MVLFSKLKEKAMRKANIIKEDVKKGGIYSKYSSPLWLWTVSCIYTVNTVKHYGWQYSFYIMIFFSKSTRSCVVLHTMKDGVILFKMSAKEEEV